MSTYQTPLGYIVKENVEGLQVFEDGVLVCTICGVSLDHYRDVNEDIDDDWLEDDIKKEIETEDIIDDQQGNC